MARTFISITITFHGGMSAISYEWAAITMLEVPSIYRQMILDLKLYVKQWENMVEKYRFKLPILPSWNFRCYSYPVGRMEDWAYAASFDSTPHP